MTSLIYRKIGRIYFLIEDLILILRGEIMNIEDREINTIATLANAVSLATALIYEVADSSLTLGQGRENSLSEQGKLGIENLVLSRIRQYHQPRIGA